MLSEGQKPPDLIEAVRRFLGSEGTPLIPPGPQVLDERTVREISETQNTIDFAVGTVLAAAWIGWKILEATGQTT